MAAFFSLMFREISTLFIHAPYNKIHPWHAVNQGFSQDSVSGRPVTNMRPKSLLRLELSGLNFAKLKRFFSFLFPTD